MKCNCDSVVPVPLSDVGERLISMFIGMQFHN